MAEVPGGSTTSRFNKKQDYTGFTSDHIPSRIWNKIIYKSLQTTSTLFYVLEICVNLKIMNSQNKSIHS